MWGRGKEKREHCTLPVCGLHHTFYFSGEWPCLDLRQEMPSQTVLMAKTDRRWVEGAARLQTKIIC